MDHCNHSMVLRSDLLLDRGKQKADKHRNGRRDDKKFDQREAGRSLNHSFDPIIGLIGICHIYYSSLVDLEIPRISLRLSAET